MRGELTDDHVGCKKGRESCRMQGRKSVDARWIHSWYWGCATEGGFWDILFGLRNSFRRCGWKTLVFIYCFILMQTFLVCSTRKILRNQLGFGVVVVRETSKNTRNAVIKLCRIHCNVQRKYFIACRLEKKKKKKNIRYTLLMSGSLFGLTWIN